MDPSAIKYVITSPLSLARVLWWYGEDGLWATALELEPVVVADLAPRFAELRAAPEVMELLVEVFHLIQERTGVPPGGLQCWQLPRLHGRYAPG